MKSYCGGRFNLALYKKAPTNGGAFLYSGSGPGRRVLGSERAEPLGYYLPTGLKLMAAPPPGASFSVRADLLVTTWRVIW